VVILQTLKHPNIIKILEFGDSGQVLKPSGRVLTGLVYIVLELVQGGLLFDVCQLVGGLGEDGGRYFFKQMLRSIEYMSSMKVAHRDLKLENILVDNDLSLKIADFGYAAFNKVDVLSSYRGTFTYMAPEIKEGKTYNGLQVDLFSAGVILFILIRGIFPFKEARKDEFFYSMLVKGHYNEYWEKVQGAYLSDECKDLLQRLLSYDPAQRPSIEEVLNHPWMAGPAEEEAKAQIVAMIQQAKDETAQQRAKARGAAQKKTKVARGDDEELQVVSAKKYVAVYKFNHFGEFLTEEQPQTILSILDSYRAEANPDLILRSDEEKKRIVIEDPGRHLQLSLKFFRIGGDEEDERMKVRFQKKSGTVQDQYELINDLLVYLNEVIIEEEDA